MNQEPLDKLNAVFDEVVSDYEDNHHLVFESESVRLNKLYGTIKKKLQSWNNKKTCIYRGCRNKSIRRSHTIQKSGPLKIISTDSSVLTPEFNHQSGEIELVEKGLSLASIFPGFCETHEKLFSAFENKKDTESPEALTLQIYRSICREVVRLNHELTYSKKVFSDYKLYRDTRILEIMKERLGQKWLDENNIKFESINMSHDPSLKAGLDGISGHKKTLAELKNEQLSEIEMSLDGKSGIELRPISINIDIQIPVALSGLGSFYISEEGHSRRIFVVLGVYPSTNNTTIVIYGKSADTPYFHWYMKQLTNSFDILNMIEQWMIRGTDHWFLNRQVWALKSKKNQRNILKEILDGSKGITHQLEFSIFDEIRKSMIETWKSEGDIKPTQLAILKREEAKLQ